MRDSELGIGFESDSKPPNMRVLEAVADRGDRKCQPISNRYSTKL